jgi:hypothetical protein
VSVELDCPECGEMNDARCGCVDHCLDACCEGVRVTCSCGSVLETRITGGHTRDDVDEILVLREVEVEDES